VLLTGRVLRDSYTGPKIEGCVAHINSATSSPREPAAAIDFGQWQLFPFKDYRCEDRSRGGKVRGNIGAH
jgi:hypothetical protein